MKPLLASLIFLAGIALGQSSAVRDGCSDAGSTDDYACNYTVAPGWVNRHVYLFQANTANTGAATFNPNGAGAKTLKKWSAGTLSDLATGDISVGQWVSCIYDNTVCQVTSLGGGAALVTAGSAGINAFNAGAATTAARSDHTHEVFRTLTWYFPGTPTAGVQVLTLTIPDGITNPSLTDMRITVNTTSASSSSVNIQRCTASCTGTSPTFSAIYSADLSLSANTRTVAKGSAPNQNTSGLAGGDQFKVNLVTVGASLADVAVTMTYKYETTN